MTFRDLIESILATIVTMSAGKIAGEYVFENIPSISTKLYRVAAALAPKNAPPVEQLLADMESIDGRASKLINAVHYLLVGVPILWFAYLLNAIRRVKRDDQPKGNRGAFAFSSGVILVLAGSRLVARPIKLTFVAAAMFAVLSLQVEILYGFRVGYMTPAYADCPIVVDLDGDGIIRVTGNTTSRQKDFRPLGRSVRFDMNGDGYEEVSEWLAHGNNDGILMFGERPTVGARPNGMSLFSTNGGIFSNGYDKLANFFGTDDGGEIQGDALEGIFLWVDDGNAIVDDGEIHSLADFGIVSLSVNLNEALKNASPSLLRSTAKRADGTVLVTEDVWFKTIDDNPSMLLSIMTAVILPATTRVRRKLRS
jgi:hypothetical protein